jgi:carbamoyl-phosphate synthase small subunit
MDALLVLEDGRVFPGQAFGAPGECAGEVVFNTGMTGYQEIVFDPSYCGQLVVMTAAHIGNTGVNDFDRESHAPQVAGFIVRSYSDHYSSWRARGSLSQLFRERGIVAISDVDTRALTRHIRSAGALRGIISTESASVEGLTSKARALPQMEGLDLTHVVTSPERYSWADSSQEWGVMHSRAVGAAAAQTALAEQLPYHIIAYDFGLKRTILRRLVDHGCRVTVVPAHTSADDVLALQPHGIFLSNGPGDPAAAAYAAQPIRGLLGRLPIFGICLGHQLLALAMGGHTYKLPFGHHGTNHPVRHLPSGHVEITSQNHGFAVDAERLPADVDVTHLNLNDHTVEGLTHRSLPAFCVQYHPEAAPGPHDATYLFQHFIDLMRDA